MNDFRLSVKEKGRTVLPVGLQRICGFAPGAELVARPLGWGRFVVETHDAVLERIWSNNPSQSATDGVEELAEWRSTSEAARQARLEAGPDDTEEASRHRASQLLHNLGL